MIFLCLQTQVFVLIPLGFLHACQVIIFPYQVYIFISITHIEGFKWVGREEQIGAIYNILNTIQGFY